MAAITQPWKHFVAQLNDNKPIKARALLGFKLEELLNEAERYSDDNPARYKGQNLIVTWHDGTLIEVPLSDILDLFGKARTPKQSAGDFLYEHWHYD